MLSIVRKIRYFWDIRNKFDLDPAFKKLLEKEMATHSSILAWKIPQTGEPGRLQSMGSQKSQTQLTDFTLQETVCNCGRDGRLSLCLSLLSPLSFTCISYLSPYLSLCLPPICLFLSITQIIFLSPWLLSLMFCLFPIYVSYVYIYLPTYLDAEEASIYCFYYLP